MSIKPDKLVISNFGSFLHADIDLKERGLVAIYGENNVNPSQNSNGSGKSTIPDALLWACYGITGRGVSGDDVVNDRMPKDCVVSFFFEKNGEHYAIIRHRKHSLRKNELQLLKGSKSLTQGTTALTQLFIDKLLGCDVDAFLASIYFAQEKMPDIPSMTDKQLKELVENAEGMSKIQTAEKLARDRCTVAEKAYQSAKVAMEKKQLELDAAQLHADSLRTLDAEWEDNQKKRLEDLAAEIKKHKSEAERIEQVATAAFETTLKGMQVKLGAFEGKKVKEKLELHKKKVESLYIDKDNVGIERTRVLTNIEIKSERIKSIDSLLASGGGTCPTCGNVVDEAHLKAEQQTLRDEIVQLHDLKDRLDVKYRDLKDDLERNLMSERLIEKALGEAADLEKQIAELEKKGPEFNNSFDIRAMKEKAAKYKELQNQKNPGDKMLNEALEKLEALHEEKELLEVEYELAEKEVERLKKAVEIFKGVRGPLLDAAAAYLNERTAKYLDVLTDGDTVATWTTLTRNAKGEEKEKFSIEVNSTTGGSSFDALSGGEKKKVRLATAWALQDLKAARSEASFSLFIADEVDDAVDKSGLERLMVLLQEKAKDKGTVFVISHNDLSHWIPDSITVVKEADKCSRIKV